MDAPAAAERAPEQLVIRPPSRWPTLGRRELWHYRELAYFLALRDLKVRYKQTLLGVTWAILQPVMYMVVFTLFFNRVGSFYSEGKPYALLTLSGFVIWFYFANAVQLAAGSLVGNAALVTKIYFPRLLAPAAPVIAGLVDLVLSTLVLFAVMAAYGVYPAPERIWFALPAVALAIVTALGVGAWLAALNVKYRDVRYIVPFLLTLWMLASPAGYSTELLPDRWQTIYALNPMAGVIEGFRWAMLGGVPPDAGDIALSTASGIVVLVVGVLYFRRLERTFADII